MKKRSPQLALKYCIETMGGQSAAARAFGFTSHWAVGKWFKDGIPSHNVWPLVAKVRAKGGKVTCHELAPEQFPPGS